MRLTSISENLACFYKKMPVPPPPSGDYENKLLLHDALAHNFLGANDTSFKGEMQGVIDEGILRKQLNLAEYGTVPTNVSGFLDFVNFKGRKTYANESKQNVDTLPLIDRTTISGWYKQAMERLNTVVQINPHFEDEFFNLPQKGKKLDILRLLETKVPLEWFAELYQK
jgi:hypothetical protein